MWELRRKADELRGWKALDGFRHDWAVILCFVQTPRFFQEHYQWVMCVMCVCFLPNINIYRLEIIYGCFRDASKSSRMWILGRFWRNDEMGGRGVGGGWRWAKLEKAEKRRRGREGEGEGNSSKIYFYMWDWNGEWFGRINLRWELSELFRKALKSPIQDVIFCLKMMLLCLELRSGVLLDGVNELAQTPKAQIFHHQASKNLHRSSLNLHHC